MHKLIARFNNLEFYACRLTQAELDALDTDRWIQWLPLLGRVSGVGASNIIVPIAAPHHTNYAAHTSGE